MSLGQLRRSAPFIDKINSTLTSLDDLAGVTDAARDVIEVLVIGLEKVAPDLTADEIEDELGMPDMPRLQAAFKALLGESGLAPGEATPPPSPTSQATAEGASADKSSESSAT